MNQITPSNGVPIEDLAHDLGSRTFYTIEEISPFAMPVAYALGKCFGVPKTSLDANMFRMAPVSEIIEEVDSRNHTSGIIALVSSVLGGGLVPALAYSPAKNAIYMNENSPNGFSLDGFGEEACHWIRHTADPEEEHINFPVQEFFGYLGKRITRQAFRLEDLRVTPHDFEKDFRMIREQIMGVEKYGFVDVGYQSMLQSAYDHMLGYVAASRVDLDNIPEGLIRATDREIERDYIERFGPGRMWHALEAARAAIEYGTFRLGTLVDDSAYKNDKRTQYPLVHQMLWPQDRLARYNKLFPKTPKQSRKHKLMLTQESAPERKQIGSAVHTD